MNIFDPFTSHSPEETRIWGKTLAGILTPGMVVGLCGTLGTGKTLLVKAVCEALEVPPDTVTSPTFTLVNEYQGKYKIIHMDVYRLERAYEFELLDMNLFLSQDAIILIEWAEKVRHLLPRTDLYIEITALNETKRRFTCKRENP
ncbi:MAG: tRNA (adenosine(37)-N6)-threonylcarbamoyltransferase complex ATPase subunit type 1 TsaE [Candidatus Aureabacteria bacterium]|nr:tRNA (adenosine(37)-N6)-threonylcarbamoyltransferase complex ATPase subunit type 1 TsaE [Candidatus Auribacterota bacterium]